MPRILPRLDLVKIINYSVLNKLKNIKIEWKKKMYDNCSLLKRLSGKKGNKSINKIKMDHILCW